MQVWLRVRPGDRAIRASGWELGPPAMFSKIFQTFA